MFYYIMSENQLDNGRKMHVTNSWALRNILRTISQNNITSYVWVMSQYNNQQPVSGNFLMFSLYIISSKSM